MIKLLKESLTSGLVADIAELTIQRSDLWIQRVRCSKSVAPVADRDSLRRDVGDEVTAETGGNILPGGLENSRA